MSDWLAENWLAIAASLAFWASIAALWRWDRENFEKIGGAIALVAIIAAIIWLRYDAWMHIAEIWGR